MPHILTASIEITAEPYDTRTERRLEELGGAARLLIARTQADKRAEFSLDPAAATPEFPATEEYPPYFLAERRRGNWYAMAYLAKPQSGVRNPQMDYGLFSLDDLKEPLPAHLFDLRRDYYLRLQRNSGGRKMLMAGREYSAVPLNVMSDLTLSVRALYGHFREHKRAGYWKIR